MNPFSLIPTALALAYAAILLCGWIESIIERRCQREAQTRIVFDPERPRGRRHYFPGDGQ